MRRRFLFTALANLAAITALTASPAQAGPIYFREHALGVDHLQFQAPFYFSGFAGQVVVDTGLAGPSDDFVVFCVDVSRPKEAVQNVVIRPLSELPDVGNPTTTVQPDAGERVAWLLNQYATSAWLSTDGAARAAALQLAIWEVLYESYGHYDITNGPNFALLYAAQNHPALLSYTQTYFTALGDQRSEAVWYDTSTGQDFAAPRSVPDGGPGTIVLFGSCAAGLLKLARRRRH
jgi:hypothetical protein